MGVREIRRALGGRPSLGSVRRGQFVESPMMQPRSRWRHHRRRHGRRNRAASRRKKTSSIGSEGEAAGIARGGRLGSGGNGHHDGESRGARGGMAGGAGTTTLRSTRFGSGGKAWNFLGSHFSNFSGSPVVKCRRERADRVSHGADNSYVSLFYVAVLSNFCANSGLTTSCTLTAAMRTTQIRSERNCASLSE